MPSVCALLPSVSEKARNSASTAINSAIFLLMPAACSTCSACSICSCALMIPLAIAFESWDHRTAWVRAQEGLSALYSGPRVRAAIGFEQSLGIDAGINLCGRERSVPKQFLDGAQVSPARQQMRREGVAQGVRRGAVGQSQHATQPLH